MKSITFKSFLKNYLKNQSEQDTMSIRLLAEEAMNGNHTIKEPLILYCYFFVDRNTANRQLVNSGLFSQFSDFCNKFSGAEEAIYYLSEQIDFPDAFQQVYRSYKCLAEKPQRDYLIKQQLRDRIEALMQAQNMCVTDILKISELRLNKGNFYGFLRGNVNLVSLEKAYSVLHYLQSRADDFSDKNR